MSSTQIQTTNAVKKKKESAFRAGLARVRELMDTRGSGTIEKVVIIGLFIFVAMVGLTKLGTSTKNALQSQAQTVESAASN